jgi:hypothetical protein
MDTCLCTTKTLKRKFREEKNRTCIKSPDFSSNYFHLPPQTVFPRALFVFPRYQHYTMKFTLVITALGFFATSATATREWSYNDHRRAVVLANLEQGNYPAPSVPPPPLSRSRPVLSNTPSQSQACRPLQALGRPPLPRRRRQALTLGDELPRTQDSQDREARD